jgi:hypothetical protein
VLDVEYNEGALKSPSLVKLCSYTVLITLLSETSTMSSALFNIVLVLNGTNWLSWAESMDAYCRGDEAQHEHQGAIEEVDDEVRSGLRH